MVSRLSRHAAWQVAHSLGEFGVEHPLRRRKWAGLRVTEVVPLSKARPNLTGNSMWSFGKSKQHIVPSKDQILGCHTADIV